MKSTGLFILFVLITCFALTNVVLFSCADDEEDPTPTPTPTPTITPTPPIKIWSTPNPVPFYGEIENVPNWGPFRMFITELNGIGATFQSWERYFYDSKGKLFEFWMGDLNTFQYNFRACDENEGYLGPHGEFCTGVIIFDLDTPEKIDEGWSFEDRMTFKDDYNHVIKVRYKTAFSPIP